MEMRYLHLFTADNTKVNQNARTYASLMQRAVYGWDCAGGDGLLD